MAAHHIVLQGRTGDVVDRGDGELDVPKTALATPLPTTFDDAYARLESLPNLFIEPDGAFAWLGALGGGGQWRLDGCLFDGGPRLQYVELKVDSPPREIWDVFLKALGASETSCMVQVATSAKFYRLSRFRDELEDVDQSPR